MNYLILLAFLFAKLPEPPPPEAKPPAVEQIIADGAYLILTDGSVWKIEPSSTPIVGSWLLPADITISSSSDKNYPFELHNTVTNNSVLARKAIKEELDMIKGRKQPESFPVLPEEPKTEP